MAPWPTIPDRWLDGVAAPGRAGHDPRVRWLGAVEAGAFRVWHKAYRSDFAQSRHAHATGSVDFNVAGGGRGMYLGQERDSRAGGVEYFRSDGDHTFGAGPAGIRVLHVIFRDEDVRPEDGRPMRGEGDCFEPDEGAAAGVAVRLLRELGGADASSALSVESLCHEILGLARRWPATAAIGAGCVGRVVDILRASPAEPVGLAMLAAEVGINAAHLARAFRAAMGVSPGEYHRRARIAEAARRLAGRDEPIVAIASGLGFADQAHLTRWFTRIVGVSPAAYRRTLWA